MCYFLRARHPKRGGEVYAPTMATGGELEGLEDEETGAAGGDQSRKASDALGDRAATILHGRRARFRVAGPHSGYGGLPNRSLVGGP